MVILGPGNGSTVGFSVDSQELGDAWHAAGIENGGSTCEDPPGLEDTNIYLAYLRDPAGNKICALHRLVKVSIKLNKKLIKNGSCIS